MGDRFLVSVFNDNSLTIMRIEILIFLNCCGYKQKFVEKFLTKILMCQSWWIQMIKIENTS